MAVNRRAFTLVEMLVASSVSTIVAASLCTLFVGLHRLVRQAFAEAELSLELRAERERLLFRTVNEGGLVTWGGLLSARDVAPQGDGVVYTAVGIQTESGQAQERGNQRCDHAGVDNALLSSHRLLTVALEKTAGGETRRARVVVPVFGCEQVRNSASLFHDNRRQP